MSAYESAARGTALLPVPDGESNRIVPRNSNPKPTRPAPAPAPAPRFPPFSQAAAAASRPASVSSLATALAVLVAFTASASDGAAAAAVAIAADGEAEGRDSGLSRGSHGAVVEEAFSCLVTLSETACESSAQAECVKVTLVSLKECVQVGGAKERGEERGEARSGASEEPFALT